ncbi:hypothetical protein V1460_32190 [Streptomyces sp. SCSIO 30461]|uniref:hypothetical protein n=1 Tax=Streptomyces sp. SCSIO 30461 TaxID=3118085 RepID=UPI0030D2EDAD
MVTAGAAQAHGDAPLAEGLTNLSELLGAPVETPWTKRYAFGLMPIGDAFLAWSKTARPWVSDTPAAPSAPSPTWWWRLPLLVLLLAAGAAPWIPALVRRHRGRRSQTEVSPANETKPDQAAEPKSS